MNFYIDLYALITTWNHFTATKYTDTKTSILHIKTINLVTSFNEIYLQQNLE